METFAVSEICDNSISFSALICPVGAGPSWALQELGSPGRRPGETPTAVRPPAVNAANAPQADSGQKTGVQNTFSAGRELRQPHSSHGIVS